MTHRSTSPPRLRSVQLLSIVRHETGYVSDSEILIRGSEQEEQEVPEGAVKLPVGYYWFKFEDADLITTSEEEKAKSYNMDSFPEPSAFEPEAAPKRAAYYWLRLKLGQPLTPAEKAAVHDYSLEDFLGDNLLFCTICGEEDHWVYNCEKYYEEYKCPYGTEYIPPGITQHEEKPENPSDVWTDSDEEYLRSLSGGFYYMVGLSELKNIHRIMINQHNDIEAVVRAGIQPKCAADYEHRTMKKAAMKDEEKDKE
ncbi:hypothetical protein ACLB2K_001083 [Fragaria x ananassa]